MRIDPDLAAMDLSPAAREQLQAQRDRCRRAGRTMHLRRRLSMWVVMTERECRAFAAGVVPRRFRRLFAQFLQPPRKRGRDATQTRQKSEGNQSEYPRARTLTHEARPAADAQAERRDCDEAGAALALSK